MEARGQLIDDILLSSQTGWGESASCPVCHKKLVREMPLQIICTALVVSHGPPTDPLVLRKNYMRCAVACSAECKAHMLACRANIDYDRATYIASEGRSPDEHCEIITFPPMSDTAFIHHIIISEISTRIAILVEQMRMDHHDRVGEVLYSIGQLVDSYFHDSNHVEQYETIGIEVPFAANSIFNKCLTIFAVRERTSILTGTPTGQGFEAADPTLFERAIIENISRQMHKIIVPPQVEHFSLQEKSDSLSMESDTTLTRVIFPVQISEQSPGKMTIQVSLTFPPRYYLREREDMR